MQSPSAEQTIQRLIFSLSELEQLGETIISGRGNFGVSSRTYLRMILGTLQVSRGAILLYHSTENHLTVEESNIRHESLTIPVTSDEISTMLQFPVIDLSAPPAELESFLNRIGPQLTSLGAKFWAPLKIRNEFLGVISLGRFFAKERMEDWDRELLNVFANQTSIAIAYSHLLAETRADKFRLYTLSETTTQLCTLLDTEAVEEEAVNHAVMLLDANAGCLMRTNPFTKMLEVRSVFDPDPDFAAEVQNRWLAPPENGEPSTTASMIQEVVTQGKTLLHNDEETARLFGRTNLIAVPVRGREERILGVLVVCDKEGRKGITLDFTAEDANLLTAFANQAGVAIENAQLYQEALEARRLQAEMDEARRIQENLLPDTVPEIPGYEVVGHCQPRGAVGGDYYDYIRESDTSWGIAIADVSGKGMQAALLMATLRAGLLSEISRQRDLPSMATTLNSLLYSSSTIGKFATFFYAQLQPEESRLTSINAGHNYPLVIRGDGSCTWLGKEKGGAPLGMFPDDMLLQIATYEPETTQLSNGDVVVFYTDGVTETENPHEEFYGEGRLAEAAKSVRHARANEIYDNIYNTVREFQGEAEQFDDLTLVVVKKK